MNGSIFEFFFIYFDPLSVRHWPADLVVTGLTLLPSYNFGLSECNKVKLCLKWRSFRQ